MKECIILAGGFGTRLQSVVKDVPKCMAEVSGKPFLEYLFVYLEKHQFNHVILSLGYKSDVIIDWLKGRVLPFEISYVVENEPLGTGGAIRFAFQKVILDSAMVINGDTFFNINTQSFFDFHAANSSDLSIALKPMLDFDRYGSVELNGEKRIIKFNEKHYCKEGLINGGVYIINKKLFSDLNLPAKFSFEKEVMESKLDEIKISGYESDAYFIDIGIPSDYEKANWDFSQSGFI